MRIAHQRIYTPVVIMDSGPAPSGASRNDDRGCAGLLTRRGSSMSNPTRHSGSRGTAVRNPYFPSVVMDSGPAPSGASRNDDREWVKVAHVQLSSSRHVVSKANNVSGGVIFFALDSYPHPDATRRPKSELRSSRPHKGEGKKASILPDEQITQHFLSSPICKNISLLA
jgi:hypothetical protein